MATQFGEMPLKRSTANAPARTEIIAELHARAAQMAQLNPALSYAQALEAVLGEMEAEAALTRPERRARELLENPGKFHEEAKRLQSRNPALSYADAVRFAVEEI